MNNNKKLLSLSLYLIFSFPVFSQQSFNPSFTKAVSVYNNAAGVNTHLYNGSEYIDYDHKITGNPFFLDSYFADGAVVYDGIFYTDVKMFYDILHDEVVIKNYNDTALLLVKEKISAFDYAGHHFEKLIADSTTAGIITTGFYEVLYDGNTKLYAKRKKEIVEKISTQYSESYFSEHNDYYIFKNNTYYPVSDKRSVLQVLKDHKNELAKFAHQNKLKFRKSAEYSMIKMVSYYDGLNNTK
jgi:hypothetical protein